MTVSPEPTCPCSQLLTSAHADFQVTASTPRSMRSRSWAGLCLVDLDSQAGTPCGSNHDRIDAEPVTDDSQPSPRTGTLQPLSEYDDL